MNLAEKELCFNLWVNYLPFFPPNTTGLIQPADQGVIAWEKRLKVKSARKALYLANKDTLPMKIFKNFNIMDVIKMLSGSWNKCSSSLLA